MQGLDNDTISHVCCIHLFAICYKPSFLWVFSPFPWKCVYNAPQVPGRWDFTILQVSDAHARTWKSLYFIWFYTDLSYNHKRICDFAWEFLEGIPKIIKKFAIA